MGSADLSIAIVTYHSDRELLRSTLRSLAAAVRCWRAARAPAARVELLLIDNGAATDPLPAPVEMFAADLLAVFDRCQLLPMWRNLGYGGAHNQVLQHGTGRFHLVLNPDLEMREDALCVGLDFLARHADVACVVPDAVDDGGNPLYLAKRYPSALVLLLRALGRFGRGCASQRMADYEMRDMRAKAAPAPVMLASGCFMLLRGSVFAAVAGFCDRYFLYFEDFDLSLRLARLGGIFCLPQMQVVHHGGRAAGKGARHVFLFCRSALRFFGQHGWRLW